MKEVSFSVLELGLSEMAQITQGSHLCRAGLPQFRFIDPRMSFPFFSADVYRTFLSTAYIGAMIN